jgi:hypothetical protein
MLNILRLNYNISLNICIAFFTTVESRFEAYFDGFSYLYVII